MTATDAVTIGQAAKQLGMGQRKLFSFMRDQKIIFKDKITGCNLPFSRFVDQGYLSTKNSSWEQEGIGERVSTKTMVTTKGLIWLQELINKK